jgi:hypothetical protein
LHAPCSKFVIAVESRVERAGKGRYVLGVMSSGIASSNHPWWAGTNGIASKTVAVGPKTWCTVLGFTEDTKPFTGFRFGSSPGRLVVWPGLFGGADDTTADTKGWNTAWDDIEGSHASVLLVKGVCAPEMIVHFLCPYRLLGAGRLLTLPLT